MGNDIKAGVILKSRFCSKGSVFQSYIDYINREEAARNSVMNKFNLYNDYMDNPEKTLGLFTKDKDTLTPEEKNNYKKLFQLAEDNGSIMWQHVISFDNRWLEEQGIYDSETHLVNEIKLRQLTRLAMNSLDKDSVYGDKAVWTAAIHFNTDNIHIHIAEIVPNWDNKEEMRGKIKLSSLNRAKAKVVNDLIENSPELKLINDIIRKNIVEAKRQNDLSSDEKYQKMFMDIMKDLPKDRRLWNYRSRGMEQFIPRIDELSKYYLETYHKEDLEEIERLLDKLDNMYKTAYGVGKTQRSYKENKEKDLYYRVGNAIYKQMRDYAKEEEKQKYEELKNNDISMNEKQFRSSSSLNYRRTQNTFKNLTNLTNMFVSNELKKYKDELDYQLMQMEAKMKENELEQE